MIRDKKYNYVKDYLFNTHALTFPRSFTIPSWAIATLLPKKIIIIPPPRPPELVPKTQWPKVAFECSGIYSGVVMEKKKDRIERKIGKRMTRDNYS